MFLGNILGLLSGLDAIPDCNKHFQQHSKTLNINIDFISLMLMCHY